MRFRCLVKSCRQYWDKCNTSFHRLRRNVWLEQLKLRSDINGRVCSIHFNKSDFQQGIDGRRFLKPDAFPKRFLSDRKITFITKKPRAKDEWITMNDTIADLRMDCSVFPVHNLSISPSIYSEHNYSKFGCKMEDNNSSERDNTEYGYPRQKLCFHIKCCRILNPRLNQNIFNYVT